MKLKALIIEDEKISRDILSAYILKYCPSVEVIGMAGDVREGMALIRNTEFDILFLDIEMPYGNAFDILDNRGNKKFETIFVTAYEKYAIDAVNSHAAYYLLKPISIDDLIKAVDYVKEKRLNSKPNIELAEDKGRIGIPNQNGIEYIWKKDIIYCNAQDNYTKIVLKNKNILASKPLKYYEDQLGTDFNRIHRSYLIRMEYVEKYYKGKGGYVEMSNGDKLDVSPKRKKAFLDWFLKR